ncbi:hypothetical protein D3C73_1463980 [compost metagenome]
MFQIVWALDNAVVVGRVVGRIQVIGDPPEAIEPAVDQVATVGQQPKRLTHALILKRRFGQIQVETGK